MGASNCGTIRLQPLPILTLLGRHEGVSGITRIWEDGDERRCLLCETCQAEAIDETRAVCTVFTTEQVTEGGAELYSLCGLPLADDEPTGLALRLTTLA